MAIRSNILASVFLAGALSACAPELPPQVVSTGSLPREANADFVLVGLDGKPADPALQGLRECVIAAGMIPAAPSRYAVQLSRTIRQRGTRVVLPDDKSEPPRRHLRHLVQADVVSVTALASGAEVYRLAVSGRIKPGVAQNLGLAGNPVDSLFCQTIKVPATR